MAPSGRETNKQTPSLVLVLGKTGVGKSTFIKAATGLDIEIGNSLNSCEIAAHWFEWVVLTTCAGTTEVQIFPMDRQTFLIDTPGFDNSTTSDIDVLHAIASCLADLREGFLSSDATTVDISGIVYVHAIDDARMVGSMMKNLRMFKEIVGMDNMRQCALVTSKWAAEDDAQLDRENDLILNPAFWRTYLRAGAITRRFENTCLSAREVLSKVTKHGPFTPRLTQEYVLNGWPLYETAAGQAASTDFEQARKVFTEDLAALRDEYTHALTAQLLETMS